MIRNAMSVIYFIFSTFCFLHSPSARAWGRHDLLTQVALQGSDLSGLVNFRLQADSIGHAAPSILTKVIPEIQKWAQDYHSQADTRYQWSVPENGQAVFGRVLTDREKLLWAIEDNITAPLDFSVTSSDQPGAERKPTFGARGMPSTGSALNVLSTFVEEPDAVIDGGFNKAPYLNRFREQMSLFYDGGSHTHTFRHYYVPSSLVPPLLSPRGVAPYRSALYARLAVGAFRIKNYYWGFRFLSWSIHYAQDATQPWHTVFLPGLSYLRISKAQMRKEVSGLHFLSEAFADVRLSHATIEQSRYPASLRMPSVRKEQKTYLSQRSYNIWRQRALNPWTISNLVTEAAIQAHDKSLSFADRGKRIFDPVIDQLSHDLQAKGPVVSVAGFIMPSTPLSFTGNGAGAAFFLRSFWHSLFPLRQERDDFSLAVEEALEAAMELSRMIITSVLEESGLLSQVQFKN